MNINRILKVLQVKWNIILAVISIIGLLIFNFIPNIDDSYFKLFMFLGLNAIMWTIIEIKTKLDDSKPNKTQRFSDMRKARPFILKDLAETMKNNKSEELLIEIVGGRIRTISDMIRELKHEMVNHRLHARNVRIKVLTINPNFIKNWNFPKTQNNISFQNRNKGNANLIKTLKAELMDYNNLECFKNNNINIEVDYYETYPNFYSYKIGDKYIYWGFFSWNNVDEDFVGPENPCYFLDKKNECFQDYFNMLTNRTQFLNIYKQHEITYN